MSTLHYHIIFRQGVYWPRVRIARFNKKEPKLKLGEVAVKVEMSVPDNIFTPHVLPVTIAENQIIRPKPEIKVENA